MWRGAAHTSVYLRGRECNPDSDSWCVIKDFCFSFMPFTKSTEVKSNFIIISKYAAIQGNKIALIRDLKNSFTQNMTS